jgi:hypothetical protein
MEVLDTIEMGFQIRDYIYIIDDFMLIGVNLSKILRQSITKQIIKNYLNTKEVYQITTTPIERKAFDWTIVEHKCLKWQMDTLYLGDYLKKELGWVKTSKEQKVNTPDLHVVPNSHGVVIKEARVFIIYIHPMKEWKNSNSVKIHWMNTYHKDYKTATYKYTYIDTKDDREVWKKDNKKYIQFTKITTSVDTAIHLHELFTQNSTYKPSLINQNYSLMI